MLFADEPAFHPVNRALAEENLLCKKLVEGAILDGNGNIRQEIRAGAETVKMTLLDKVRLEELLKESESHPGDQLILIYPHENGLNLLKSYLFLYDFFEKFCTEAEAYRYFRKLGFWSEKTVEELKEEVEILRAAAVKTEENTEEK